MSVILTREHVVDHEQVRERPLRIWIVRLDTYEPRRVQHPQAVGEATGVVAVAPRRVDEELAELIILQQAPLRGSVMERLTTLATLTAAAAAGILATLTAAAAAASILAARAPTASVAAFAPVAGVPAVPVASTPTAAAACAPAAAPAAAALTRSTGNVRLTRVLVLSQGEEQPNLKDKPFDGTHCLQTVDEKRELPHHEQQSV